MLLAKVLPCTRAVPLFTSTLATLLLKLLPTIDALPASRTPIPFPVSVFPCKLAEPPSTQTPVKPPVIVLLDKIKLARAAPFLPTWIPFELAGEIKSIERNVDWGCRRRRNNIDAVQGEGRRRVDIDGANAIELIENKTLADREGFLVQAAMDEDRGTVDGRIDRVLNRGKGVDAEIDRGSEAVGSAPASVPIQLSST